MAEPALATVAGGREPFEIADHGAPCCVLARTWLEGLDATFHRGRARASPPAWIGQRLTAGGTPRAVHWCEIPEAAALDGAALAALGRGLWRLRCEGIRAVQLVERSAGGALAYREAIGREVDGRIEIWDRGAWLRPERAAAALAGRATGEDVAAEHAGPTLRARVTGERAAAKHAGPMLDVRVTGERAAAEHAGPRLLGVRVTGEGAASERAGPPLLGVRVTGERAAAKHAGPPLLGVRVTGEGAAAERAGPPLLGVRVTGERAAAEHAGPRLLGVRVTGEGAAAILRWGEHRLATGAWTAL